MQRFFTKHLFLLIVGFVSVDMMGQAINSVEITAPDSVAGAFTTVRQTWGSQSNTPIVANASFVNDGNTTAGTIYDGCQAPINNLTGTIAFVDRGGGCPFTDKVLAAQNKGAIAVVICNNNPSEAPFVGAGTNAAITIPSFMISYTDCQKIRYAIIDGVAKAELKYLCRSDYPASVVWGNNPKEGDFDGGLNSWIATSENTWDWASGGLISGGAYGGSQQSTSKTACNGIAAFNSDFLDNGGVSGGDGTGPCPASSTNPCIGGLISPNIDLSSKGEIKGLVVQFTQNLLEFGSGYAIVASKDGGNTWPDTISINLEYLTFNRTTGEQVRIGLCGYEGVSQVRIQFLYFGNYYYWGIDDVMILNEYVADTKVNRNFYAAAPSLKTPVSQLAPMPFVADITNNGNADATNTKLEVTIRNEGNNVIGSIINNYGNVASCSEVQNKVFNDTYTPPSTVGLYRGNYTISSDGETLNGDNTVPFYFLNTEKTFGNMFTEAEWGAAYMRYVFTGYVEGISGNPYYSVGNAYYLPKGKGYKASKFRFGFANTIATVTGTFVLADLFAWNDNGDGVCSDDERVKVGSNFIEITSSMNPRNIEADIWGVDEDGFYVEGKDALLDNNTQYLLMIHSTFFTNVKQEFLGHIPRVFNQDQQSMLYQAVNLAYDSLGMNRASGSFFNWTSGTSEDDPALRDYYQEANEGPAFNLGGTNAYVEMDIEEVQTSTYDIAKSGIATIFPNPAARELFIDVAFEKVSQNVRVDLISIDGRTAVSKSFSNVKDSRLSLDLSDVVSGTYSVLIHTDSGVITRKAVVQK